MKKLRLLAAFAVVLSCASCAGLPFHLQLVDRVDKLQKRVEELEKNQLPK